MLGCTLLAWEFKLEAPNMKHGAFELESGRVRVYPNPKG